MTGRPLPGMCSADDEVDAVKIFKAIVRAEVEHLAKRMRHAEGGA